MLIDTHCHLDFECFDDQRESLLLNCHQQNIRHFINPATTYQRWDKLISLHQTFPQITIALGLHPCFIEQHTTEHLDQLDQMLSQHSIHLVGEIGLDKRFPEHYTKQLDFFAQQLSIAQRYDCPVIIHSVKAHSDTLQAIKSHKVSNGIIHAFNGSYEIAKQYIDLGFKLGIGSILSYPHNKLSHVISKLPLSALVLETDSPDMPLYGSTGINSPLLLTASFARLCELRKESAKEILTIVSINSLNFIK